MTETYRYESDFKGFWQGIKRDYPEGFIGITKDDRKKLECEDYFKEFWQGIEDDRKKLEEKRKRLKEKILRLKRRELYEKYVSLAITGVFGVLFAVQLAYPCFGSALPSSLLIVHVLLLATALISFCSTLFSTVNSTKNKRLKKELKNLRGDSSNIAELKESDSTSTMYNCLQLTIMSVIILNILSELRDTAKVLDASDYFSLTLAFLEVIGEFEGDEILLVCSILSSVTSGFTLYKACNKESIKTSDVMREGITLVGSLILLSRKIMFMTSEASSGVTAPAMGLIGIACIMIGCVINIYSCKSKLDNITMNKGVASVNIDGGVCSV